MSNAEMKVIMQVVLVVGVDRLCRVVARSLSAEATNWPIYQAKPSDSVALAWIKL